MVPTRGCLFLNLDIPDAISEMDANPFLAVLRRVEKRMRGFPREMIELEVSEELAKCYGVRLEAIFLLGRDVPGLGNRGDFIWLVRDDGKKDYWQFPSLDVGSAHNFYFVNARTAEVVALFPPGDIDLLAPKGLVARVLYWPEEMKPPKK